MGWCVRLGVGEEIGHTYFTSISSALKLPCPQPANLLVCPFCSDTSQQKMAGGWKSVHTRLSLKAQGTRIFGQLEPGKKPCPLMASSAKGLRGQQGLIFVFVFVCLFSPPRTLRSGRGVSGSEVELRCCSCVPRVGFCMGGFLSERERVLCWALQQHYREADLSFPVSIASAALGKRESAHPHS